MNKYVLIGILTLLTVFGLSACGGSDENVSDENNGSGSHSHEEMDAVTDEESDAHSDHEGMNHSGSSEVPEGLTEAKKPAYPVGSKAIINAQHMAGMNGAEAEISGAFDTTVYSVTYTSTTDGELVKDHKWVVHEEIENEGSAPFQPGDEVVLKADHMDGMNGAAAVIDSAEHTTVYMVDYIDTETEEAVTYHKWVTEGELSSL